MRVNRNLLSPIPVPLPTHDRFGFPNFMIVESSEEREHRVATVKAIVAQVYKAVVHQLRDEEARQLFVSVTKRPRGKHGKRKALSPDRDWTLLREFDAEVDRSAEGDASALARVSRRIFIEKGKGFGASAGAIEKQLRRLLTERERRRARDARGRQRWRERYKTVTGTYPAPTLLELAVATEGADKK